MRARPICVTWRCQRPVRPTELLAGVRTSQECSHVHFVAHIRSIVLQLQSAPGTMELHGAPCVVFGMSRVSKPQLLRAEAIAQGSKALGSSVRAVDRFKCEVLDRVLSKTCACLPSLQRGALHSSFAGAPPPLHGRARSVEAACIVFRLFGFISGSDHSELCPNFSNSSQGAGTEEQSPRALLAVRALE